MRKGGQGTARVLPQSLAARLGESEVKANAGKRLMESLSSERMASTNDPLITVKIPIILLQCNLEFFQITKQDILFSFLFAKWKKKRKRFLAAFVISSAIGQQGQSSQRDAFSQGKHWIIHIMHTVFHDNKLLCSSCVFSSFTLRNRLLNFIEPPGAGLCGYKLK